MFVFPSERFKLKTSRVYNFFATKYNHTHSHVDKIVYLSLTFSSCSPYIMYIQKCMCVCVYIYYFNIEVVIKAHNWELKYKVVKRIGRAGWEGAGIVGLVRTTYNFRNIVVHGKSKRSKIILNDFINY